MPGGMPALARRVKPLFLDTGLRHPDMESAERPLRRRRPRRLSSFLRLLQSDSTVAMFEQCRMAHRWDGCGGGAARRGTGMAGGAAAAAQLSESGRSRAITSSVSFRPCAVIPSGEILPKFRRRIDASIDGTRRRTWRRACGGQGATPVAFSLDIQGQSTDRIDRYRRDRRNATEPRRS